MGLQFDDSGFSRPLSMERNSVTWWHIDYGSKPKYHLVVCFHDKLALVVGDMLHNLLTILFSTTFGY